MITSLYKKGLVLGIICLFAGASFIPNVSSDISSLSAGNILYVGGTGPGNYSKIQDAIDNASDGDTAFVYSGRYNENVVVDKSIDLVGEDRDTTIINGCGGGNAIFGVITLLADSVTVSGFRITNSGNGWSNSGIFMGVYGTSIGSNYSTITDNIIEENMNGIMSKHSFNCDIQNNIIENNIETGITIYDGNNNYVSKNTIRYNVYGIVIAGLYNEIYRNIISFNTYKGIQIGYNSNYHSNLIHENNLVNNQINAQDHIDSLPSPGNTWDRNFWDRTRYLPYPIKCTINIASGFQITWIKIDWHPAQEPYDIYF